MILYFTLIDWRVLKDKNTAKTRVLNIFQSMAEPGWTYLLAKGGGWPPCWACRRPGWPGEECGRAPWRSCPPPGPPRPRWTSACNTHRSVKSELWQTNRQHVWIHRRCILCLLVSISSSVLTRWHRKDIGGERHFWQNSDCSLFQVLYLYSWVSGGGGLLATMLCKTPFKNSESKLIVIKSTQS